MAKFKVGDIVIGNDKNPYSVTAKGVKCEVVKVYDEHYIRVRALNDFASFIVYPECFDLVNGEITIKQYGNKVVAKYGDKTAVARCNPKDEFNFEIGAKLAFERLFEKPLLNTKICIVEGDGEFQTGQIYEIVNGKITQRDGTVLPYDFAFNSIEELYDYFLPEEKRKLHDGHGWSKKGISFVEVKE